MARARPVSAEEKTYTVYNYDDLNCSKNDKRRGKFEKAVSKYEGKSANEAKFHCGKSKIYVRGRKEPIDLSAKIGSGDNKIYRYCFWVKYGKHHTSGWTDNAKEPKNKPEGRPLTWGTVGFVATTEPIRIYSLIRIVFLLTQEVGQFLLQTN